MFVEQPHAQRHTDLRVIALRRTGDCHGGRQQLTEPLFHHRLSVAARDADDRDIKLITMTLSQPLQGS